MNVMNSDIKLSACYLLPACGSVCAPRSVLFCRSRYLCLFSSLLLRGCLYLCRGIFAWLGAPPGLPRVFGALELAEQIPARGANGGLVCLRGFITRLRCGHSKFWSDRRVIVFALELYYCYLTELIKYYKQKARMWIRKVVTQADFYHLNRFCFH